MEVKKIRTEPETPASDSLDVALNSPAIQRLIEEVRAEEFSVPRSYNRTFNRHNR
jgi:sulfatase maturation enzyme AslB (radical SAM superfamily)